MHRIDHGTMFYKAVKQGLIDPKNSVQVGIRTYNSDTLGVNIIDAREVFEIGPCKTAEKIKSILGDTPTSHQYIFELTTAAAKAISSFGTRHSLADWHRRCLRRGLRCSGHSLKYCCACVWSCLVIWRGGKVK